MIVVNIGVGVREDAGGGDPSIADLANAFLDTFEV